MVMKATTYLFDTRNSPSPTNFFGVCWLSTRFLCLYFHIVEFVNQPQVFQFFVVTAMYTSY